jgi:hypothetical protein
MFLIGCTTLASIQSDYHSINYKDGISRQEATVISQKELLDTKQNNYYMTSLPDVEDENAYWRVIFSSRYWNKYAYIVDVDKGNGEILNSFETNDINDVFRKEK